MEPADLTRHLSYFYEYVIEHMLLPGQVENWVLIMDLQDLGVTSVPYSVLYRLQ